MFQVWANGGGAVLLAVIYLLYPDPVIALGYVIYIAGITADTWSSEIGRIARQQPVHMISRQPVPNGTSGGITILGSLGAIAGALTIALITASSGTTAILITGGGVFIAFLDSLCGATIQGDEPLSGSAALRRPNVTNNVVNALSATGGTGLMLIVVSLVL